MVKNSNFRKETQRTFLSHCMSEPSCLMFSPSQHMVGPTKLCEGELNELNGCIQLLPWNTEGCFLIKVNHSMNYLVPDITTRAKMTCCN